MDWDLNANSCCILEIKMSLAEDNNFDATKCFMQGFRRDCVVRV